MSEGAKPGAGAALGGDEASVWDGIGLLLADAFLIVVIVAFPRKGARLSAGTLGIRRTRFWPAVGWACAFFAATLALEGLWTCSSARTRETSPAAARPRDRRPRS